MANQGAGPSRYIIDRFEDNGWAVLEHPDGFTVNVRADWLPEESKEGDALSLEVGKEEGKSILTFTIDTEATEELRNTSRELLERLREKSKDTGGDIEL